MTEKNEGFKQGEPDIDIAETAGSALGEAGASASNNSNNNNNTANASLELVLEKEEDFDEEDGNNNIESWGVYVAGPDKILLGLFWDKELAQFFLDSVRNSEMINRIREEVENNN